jgi:dCMP deaminase
MNWIDFYMGLAFAISRKSPDPRTKHGCVITDIDNRPLGFGYNGFPRGADDQRLPRTPPEKYKWMFHAEENAVANCQHRPKDSIAYVTGPPCQHCLYTLWQHGVRRVWYGPLVHKSYTQADIDYTQRFIAETGLEFHHATNVKTHTQVHRLDLSWLAELVDFLTKNNFLPSK